MLRCVLHAPPRACTSLGGGALCLASGGRIPRNRSPHLTSPTSLYIGLTTLLLINTQELSQVQAADTNHAAEEDKLDQEDVFKESSAAGGPKEQGQVSPGRGSSPPPPWGGGSKLLNL